MNHDRALRPWLLVAAILLLPSCTWVKITDDARALPILEPGQVASCQRLGSATTNVPWKVAGIRRGSNKVRVELDNLARERAFEMGGNALVRDSIREGTGQYSVFLCS